MANTVWKGQLTFGLVSFPVRLVRAARKDRIPLRYVRELDSPQSPTDDMVRSAVRGVVENPKSKPTIATTDSTRRRRTPLRQYAKLSWRTTKITRSCPPHSSAPMKFSQANSQFYGPTNSAAFGSPPRHRWTW